MADSLANLDLGGLAEGVPDKGVVVPFIELDMFCYLVDMVVLAMSWTYATNQQVDSNCFESPDLSERVDHIMTNHVILFP
jgi:hypothetical protein